MAINLNGTTGITTTGLTSNGIDDNATSTAMTLDTSGNVLVGTTSTGAATASNGAYITPDGQIIGRSDGIVSYLNRRSTDGQILQFLKDGSTVGSIEVAGSDLIIGGRASSVKSGIRFDNSTLTPAMNGADVDASVDLGYSSRRFKDLYLSGGVYLGGTGSANKLDHYEEGTWTPTTNGITTGVTMSVISATYTKIGRSVTVQLYVAFSGTTSSQQVQIGGFPFTSIGSNQYFVSVINHNTSAGEKILRMSPNDTVAFGMGFNNAAVAFSAFNGSIFITSMTYTTS